MSAADLGSRIEEARNGHQKAIDLFENARETLQLEEERQSMFDSPFDRTFGWRPPEEGARPYAYIGTEGGTSSMGAAAFSVRESNANVDMGYIQIDSGVLRDGDNTRFGYRGEAGAFRVDVDVLDRNNNFSESAIGNLSLEIGTARSGTSVGNDGLTVGAVATAASVSYSGGRSDPESSMDTTTRVGLAVGVGAEGRIHWNDADNDGLREYGYGGDYAFLSADFTTEDPLLSLLPLTTPHLLSTSGTDFNLTELTFDTMREAFDFTTED